MSFLDCTCFSTSPRTAIIYLVETMTQALARLVGTAGDLRPIGDDIARRDCEPHRKLRYGVGRD
jgi:hypothetical protein